ncbi:RNA polymerase sigma-70 factor (ECF subfamily) [Nonlabens dokdonensis]|jgi:RNA polymerase sigma-70 factor (ECF subfamily)|uniref:DNA-directed RNA polymerase, sigma-70 region 2, ECF-type subfamily n=2 Tax=Nonlabens dokdonensis TaxID=328515 RepID=L7WAA5_NONDD|nr:sigma-70 family RNA polymerase sigma factor [Nonlabens dokdonensis]AGC78615.1 DNA-directed RNA polymerase, sigma-70 region 2, ECF-type subfamily [Nonlabens dokdonensis DSW-6]PZX39255.1 RNA polymerase sigma-70 factor (ECF subfamily) [Nonlabens dokdonensis]
MKIENVKDAVLVKQYINGSEKGLEVLITRHKQRIYSFIFSKVMDRDITEDIFQDTFIKVIRTLKKGKYNEEGKFLPWVMRIAHNLVIDHFRRNKRMPKFQSRNDFDIFDVISDGEESMEYDMITNQMHEDVRKLVEELPADQKEVLTMRIFKEMSFKEIAACTDVSINTALGRMRYALINLRKVIDKHNIVLTR